MSNITKEYIATIHKDKKSSYGVSFHDFAGCISFGKNLEEVKNNAQEALQFHVDGMIEDKESLPIPATLDEVQHKNEDAVAFIVISVNVPAQAKRINITIDEGLLRKLDKRLQKIGDNRSHFFQEAAKKELSNCL